MTSLNRDSWLASLRASIPEISPAEALTRQAQGNVLIDVREDGERASGTPLGAVGLSRGFLELRIEQLVPDRSEPVLLLCGSGQRSLLAAEALQRMGYQQVASVAGGFQQWKAEGLPVALGALDSDAAERYARQLQLPQVGEAGQARLASARVALLGAGGHPGTDRRCTLQGDVRQLHLPYQPDNAAAAPVERNDEGARSLWRLLFGGG